MAESAERAARGMGSAGHRRVRAQRPKDAPRPFILFYDASCGLCRRSVSLIACRDPVKPLIFIDVNDDEAMARYPQVDRLEALERVILLSPDGMQRTAYDAVTGVIRLLPRWRRLHGLARLWPIALVGHAAYHLVGHNRHRISRLVGWE